MAFAYQLINGEVLEREKALIPINDLGLLRCYSIFEYLRVHEGVPMFIEDHLERFTQSATVMDLVIPWSKEEVRQMCHALIERNEGPTACLRIVLTGGYSEDGSTPGTPNIYMLLHRIPQYPPEAYDPGAMIITSHYQRDIPTVKTTNYIQSAINYKKMKEKGALEILFYLNENVTECSRANIFFVDKEDTIITPHSNVLRGITRKHVMEVASNDYRIVERGVTIHDVPEMQEVFITSTTKGIMPIRQMDEMLVGAAGPVTRDLMEKWRTHIKAYEESYVSD
jgi:branched-chain amino acid aminotransferase